MLIFGHRGTGVTMHNSAAQEEARRREGVLFPENTLAAFKWALDHGADGIELDVIKTAGGDLAVIHDEPLNLHIAGADRKSRALGFVHQKTKGELRRMDAGDGLGIPALRDVFALAASYGPRQPYINVEIKGEDAWTPAVDQAREFCQKTGYPHEKIVFSSFDHAQLEKLRAADSSAKIGLIFNPTGAGVTWPIRLHPETGGAGHRKAFTVKYADRALAKIKPTSLHVAARNFKKGADYAAKHDLDLFVWASREKPPERDPRIKKIILSQGENPRIHVVTDFPAQVAKILRIAAL